MLVHAAIAIRGGFAVAYRQPSGHLCAVMDCPTREIAEQQAERLNLHQQAQQKAAELAGLREHAFKEARYGRTVRFFEDDAFA